MACDPVLRVRVRLLSSLKLACLRMPIKDLSLSLNEDCLHLVQDQS